MLLAVIIAGVWAYSSSLPIQTTPLRDYILREGTSNPDGTKALVAKADQLVADKASPSFYGAFKKVLSDDKVDLQAYYPALNARDVKNLTKRNSLILNELLRRSQSKFRLGLDLAGGVSFTFKVDLSKLTDKYLREQAMEKAQEIITSRVDGLGVAEPVVRRLGEDSIEVQMPGLSLKENPEVADTLKAPAQLSFCLVSRNANPQTDEAPLGYQRMVEENEDPVTGEIVEQPYFVKKIPEMTGAGVAQAYAVVNDTGTYRIALRFTSEGGKRFAEVTKFIADENARTNTTGQLAIVLDGKLYSAPSVHEAILGGSAEITGSFTQREATELANVLNNPLEVGLAIDSTEEVGPTLADQARDASLMAAAIGCGIVAVFMIAYYGWMGIIAVLGIGFTMALILGSMAGIGATFSLPGIAALVLTVGMAVDSNILIFERMREELKEGKPLGVALEAGHARAFSTIFDANLTTLVTALIMVWLGAGPVKGFGIILSVGIVATLFSTLVLSRMLMTVCVGIGLFKKALRLDLFQIRNVPFLSAAPVAFALSWAIIAFGMFHFATHFDQAWGIDFKGGEEATLSFEKKLTPIEIEKATQGMGEVNAIYQSVLGDNTEQLRLQTDAGKAEGVIAALNSAYPDAHLNEVSKTAIGASVGAEIQRGAIWSVIAALLAMLIYIAFRFEIGYGMGALGATVHDILMTIGMYVLVGGQFSAPMIAALLLVIGYSVNDTIVVFDRIREELKLNPHLSLKQVIELAVNITLSRTILTSFTTFLATLALYIFGAGVVSQYAQVFLFGIITGTYSSIFIAAPIFYWWHRGDRRGVEAKADPISTVYSQETPGA